MQQLHSFAEGMGQTDDSHYGMHDDNQGQDYQGQDYHGQDYHGQDYQVTTVVEEQDVDRTP